MSPASVPQFEGVPDLLIERYLCGELPPDQALRVEEAARASPALALHLESRRASQRAFAAVRPFGPVRARLQAKQDGTRWWIGVRWVLPALGLCAVLALVAVRSLPSGADGNDRVRVRGGLTARVLVKRGEAVFEQGPGVVLRPGDRVRVEVEDVEGGTLYVVALSDRGRTTPLHGFTQTGGTVGMEPGRMVLPGSLELDAAPEREALVVVLASREDGAPSAEAVLRWVEETARGSEFPPHPAPLAGTRYAVRALPKELP